VTDQHREIDAVLAYIADLEAEIAAAREHLDDLIGAAIVAGEPPGAP
jgi:hypothetical protein